jgi:hypothetical protein
MIKLRTLALFVIMLLSLVGCASINVDNMVAVDISNSVKYPTTVAVTVNGGSPGVQWYSGTISPEDFRTAVIKSLENCSLFKAIEKENISNYILNADIQYIGSHPGFDMTSWVKVKWSLLERAKGETVWSAQIDTEGHAGVGDAFVGAKRQIMALERGAKENIEQALKQIRELKL